MPSETRYTDWKRSRSRHRCPEDEAAVQHERDLDGDGVRHDDGRERADDLVDGAVEVPAQREIEDHEERESDDRVDAADEQERDPLITEDPPDPAALLHAREPTGRAIGRPVRPAGHW
jgi:hypothetical protein